MTSTPLAELRSRRLFALGLRGTDATSPVELVRRGVAVQAQEYLPAQWGLAQRLVPEVRPTAGGTAALLDGGEILRTHVLRPTWHVVDPADARWLLELSAERVHRLMAAYDRRHGIEGARAASALDTMAEAVAGGRHRTRAELAEALQADGWMTTGGAIGFLLMHAELERVLISGASSGKQRTYAAFDERVPPSPPRPRDEALAELAERYLLTRSPASTRDLSAWSGFGLRDVRAALLAAAERTGGRIERFGDDPAEELWHDASVSAAWRARGAARATADDDPERVDLLQAYDEFIMGYAAPRAYLQPPGRTDSIAPEFPLHALMAGGVMFGRWAPLVKERSAVVRLEPWRRMSRAEHASFEAGAAEIERFLGVPVTVDVAAVVE
ncbi:winged helix DNA-binding domain-containing protein [Agromyces sp. MMS24-K17]|uniref:winged helix DNA-binding domain-containing protein n=1 Tax=Agromyces sp. MMS24-K17 TaxID=3372850 RepID=UPI003754F173